MDARNNYFSGRHITSTSSQYREPLNLDKNVLFRTAYDKIMDLNSGYKIWVCGVVVVKSLCGEYDIGVNVAFGCDSLRFFS